VLDTGGCLVTGRWFGLLISCGDETTEAACDTIPTDNATGTPLVVLDAEFVLVNEGDVVLEDGRMTNWTTGTEGLTVDEVISGADDAE